VVGVYFHHPFALKLFSFTQLGGINKIKTDHPDSWHWLTKVLALLKRQTCLPAARHPL